jgi:hypothetical protein
MRRRVFLIASTVVQAMLRAQSENLAGRRSTRSKNSVSRYPAVTPANLRTADLRRSLYAARPIEADCFRATAYGAGFESAGDSQSMDPVFQRLAQLDPWMSGAALIADIALLGGGQPWAQFLLELHEQFDIVSAESDLSAYRLLILPDPRALDAVKLRGFLKFGGTVYTPPSSGISRGAFFDALRSHVPKPAVTAPGLPPEAEVTFLERRTPGGIRRVGHVLYYPDDRPGTLRDVQLSFRLPQHPLGVITIPDQRPIEFVHNEFLTTFTLPRIVGHQAIAFE